MVKFENFKHFCLKRKIAKILNYALKVAGVNYKGFYVSVSLISPEEIRNLNLEHRKFDKVTDVLSFPMLDLQKGKNLDLKNLSKEINPKTGLINLGDIVVCEDVAKNQALNLGHSYKREMCFLVLHGFLHLLGYDHLNETDENEMSELAEKILKINKVRRY